MRKLILLFGLIALFQNVYTQKNFEQKDSVQIIHPNQYSTENEISELKRELNELNGKLSDITCFKNNITLGFWLGLIATLIASFFSIGWAVREVVRQKLSEFTGIEKKIIERNLKEFDKHNFLRENAKIIVLSKNDKFDNGFKKVMKLFGLDLKYSDSYIKVEDLKTYGLKKLINELIRYDIVVIENIVKSTWDMDDITIKQQFVDLSNEICEKTSIVYFGKSYPTDGIQEDKQYLISFVNAPSQLYGNLLNMLKYRSEMGIKVDLNLI